MSGNENKFEKLLERQEYDYKINLLENTFKELNTKAYVMMVKKEEALDQWLDK